MPLSSSQADLFSVAPAVGSGALSSRTRSHRSSGTHAVSLLGAITPRWRFLKGDSSLGLGPDVARGFVHSLPLPASIPLTAEGRAYLAAYEAHQAKLAAESSLAMSSGSGQTSQPTFRSLLAAQEAAERERSELERIRSEHSAWQRLHGLVPFERFAAWRKDAAASGETVSAEQRLEEETRRTNQMQKQWEQEQQQQAQMQREEGGSMQPAMAASAAARSAAAEEAAAAVSAAMKTNFMPAVLASTLHPSGAAATADHSRPHSHAHHTHAHHHHKHNGRAEFMAQLEQMELEDQLKLQQQMQAQEKGVTVEEEKSESHTDSTSSTTAPHPQPPAVPRPRSSGRRSAGRVRGGSSSGTIAEERTAELVAEHMPAFGQTDLEASMGAAAAIEASHSARTATSSTYPPPRSASSRGRSRGATAADSGHSHTVHFGQHLAAPAAAPADADAADAAAPGSGSSSGSSSRSSSRDSSPVILWRQTNRVKEALDIPQELRSVFLAEPDEDEPAAGEGEDGEEAEAALPGRMKSTAIYKPQPLSALDRIAAASARDSDPSVGNAASNALQELEYNLNPRMQAARQRAKAAKVRSHRARLLASMANGALPVQPLTSAALRAQPPPPDSSFTYKLPRAQPPKKYGAWYLPTSLWIAEQKPVFKSPISSRVNVLQPHMSLGSWNARTTSLHGAETLQLGQAEYEEVRRTAGMSGLLSWAELQEREAASGLRGGFALGSSIARATLGGRSIVDDDSADEEDDIDAGSKINAIKAKALEARNRRRREAEAKKVAAYERARGRKQKAMRAKARAARGGPFSRVDGEDENSDAALGAEDESASPSEPPSAGLVASGSSSVPAALRVLSGENSSLEEKLASLKDALPQLEIAHQYKAYIQRLGSHARMPHFLRKVEVSPEAMQAQREEHAYGGAHHHLHGGAIVKAAVAATTFAAAGAAHATTAGATTVPHTDRLQSNGSQHPSAAALPRHHSTSRSVTSSGLSQRVDLGSEEHKQGAHTQRDYRFA